MKKIRILFAIPNFITAGSGREMFNIVEHLDKQIFDIIIVVQQAGGNIYSEAIEEGYNVIVYPFLKAEQLPFSLKYTHIKKAVRFFKPFNIDIWQSFNWSSDFTESIIARLCNAKYVYVKKNMNWGRKAWIIKSLASNAVIARNTTLIRKIFSSRWYRNKAHYITGGVDVLKFSSGSRTEARRIYQLPPNAVVVTCVAQIVRIKNQSLLIQAMTALPDIYLVLSGSCVDKNYAEELKQLIIELHLEDRVRMIGYTSSVSSLLAATDIFVLPTSDMYGHEEGCPVALLEAMAAKVPVIASAVAGNTDLVIHGTTGLLFNCNDKNALAAAIQQYIDDLQYSRQVAANAYQQVLQKHTLEQEAKSFEQLYKKLSYQTS